MCMIIGEVITCRVTKSVCLSVFQWFICNCLRRVAERVHWSVHCLTFWSSNVTHGTTNWAGCSHLDARTHTQKKTRVSYHFRHQQTFKLKTEISAPSTSSARPQPFPDRQIDTNLLRWHKRSNSKSLLQKLAPLFWRTQIGASVLEDTSRMKRWEGWA